MPRRIGRYGYCHLRREMERIAASYGGSRALAELRIQLPKSVPTKEARLALAIGLYSTARLTQGEAAQLAGLDRVAFIQLLAARGVPFTNIDAEDLKEE